MYRSQDQFGSRFPRDPFSGINPAWNPPHPRAWAPSGRCSSNLSQPQLPPHLSSGHVTNIGHPSKPFYPLGSPPGHRYGKLERVHSCVQSLLRDEQQPQIWEQLGQIYESEQEWEDAVRCYQTAARYHGGYELTAHISRLQQTHLWNIHSNPPHHRPKSLPRLQQVWDLMQHEQKRHFGGKRGPPQLKRQVPPSDSQALQSAPHSSLGDEQPMKRRRSGSPEQQRRVNSGLHSAPVPVGPGNLYHQAPTKPNVWNPLNHEPWVERRERQDPRLPPHASSYSPYCPPRPPPPLHQQPRPPSDLNEARSQRSPAEVIPAPPPLHVPYDQRRSRIPPQKITRTDLAPPSDSYPSPVDTAVSICPPPEEPDHAKPICPPLQPKPTSSSSPLQTWVPAQVKEEVKSEDELEDILYGDGHSTGKQKGYYPPCDNPVGGGTIFNHQTQGITTSKVRPRPEAFEDTNLDHVIKSLQKIDDSGLFAPKKVKETEKEIRKSPQHPELDIKGKHLSHELAMSEGSYSGGKRSSAQEEKASFCSSSIPYHKDTSGKIQVLGLASSPPSAPALVATHKSLSPNPALPERKGNEEAKEQSAGCSQLFDFPSGQLAEPFEEAAEFAKILPDGLDDIMKMLDESIEKEEGGARSCGENFVSAAPTACPPAEVSTTSHLKSSTPVNVVSSNLANEKPSEAKSGELFTYYGPKKAILGQEHVSEAKPALHGGNSVLKSLASVLEGQKYSYRGGHSLKPGGGQAYFSGATMVGKRNVDPYTAQSTSHRAWDSKTGATPTSDVLGHGVIVTRPGVRTETDILEDISRACETLVEGSRVSGCSRVEKEDKEAPRPDVIVEKKLDNIWGAAKQDIATKAKPKIHWGADNIEGGASGRKLETSRVAEKSEAPQKSPQKTEEKDECKPESSWGVDRVEAAVRREESDLELKKSFKAVEKKAPVDKSEVGPCTAKQQVASPKEIATADASLERHQESPKKPTESQKPQGSVRENGSTELPSIRSPGGSTAATETDNTKVVETERPQERFGLTYLWKKNATFCWSVFVFCLYRLSSILVLCFVCNVLYATIGLPSIQLCATPNPLLPT